MKFSGLEKNLVTNPNERNTNSVSFIAEKIGLMIPNLTADVTETQNKEISIAKDKVINTDETPSNEPKKKIYAKEAWPGKKSMTHHHSFMSIN